MTAVVTEQGILIPKQLLQGASRVEILEEPGRIVVVLQAAPDPIVDLGTNPITIDVSDASVHLDKYLYRE